MLRALVLCILLVLPGLAQAQNLFIMGWDGAGKRNVDELLRQGYLPNLERFLKSGGKLIDVETHTQTATIAGWTTIFTGMTYDLTGVAGNRSYEGGEVKSLDFWLKNLPYTYSFLFPLQTQADPLLNVGWFTSKGFLSDNPNTTPLNAIAENADSYLMVPPDAPQFGDDYIQVLARAAIRFISAYPDHAVFLHTNPDHYGHKYGENSERYLREIVRSDAVFGAILPSLSPDTIVIITTDHGFDEGGFSHFNAPDCWMATNLNIHPIFTTPRKGANMRDIPYTLLKRYNVPAHPALRGKNLE